MASGRSPPGQADEFAFSGNTLWGRAPQGSAFFEGRAEGPAV
jgi:hypothetical protein